MQQSHDDDGISEWEGHSGRGARDSTSSVLLGFGVEA